MPQARSNALAEIRASDRLPSPRGVALEILRLTRNDEVSTAQLGKVLGADPALAGQILRYANSAAIRGGQPARSLNEAVVRLGVATVRQLALGFSLLSSARRGPCEAFDYPGFWTRSLGTAVCAQSLCKDVARLQPDEAFTCGLLGGLGRLCLASVHPVEYAAVLRAWQEGSVESLLRLEQEALSTDHNEVCAALFADWGLPATYQEAVRFLVDDAGLEALPEPRRTLPRLLHLGNQLAAVCTAEPAQRGPLVRELLLRGTALGLPETVLTEGCERALAQWRDLGEVLGLLVGDVPPIAELVARARQDCARAAIAPDGEEPGTGRVDVRTASLRILVVDDSAVDRHLLGRILQDAGHEVAVADDGQQALRLALRTCPQMILTDWMMPRLSGIELCAALRRSPELAHTYVIVMTAQEENDKLVQAFAAGADDYLVKPINRRILGARLQAAQRLIGLRELVELDREEIRRYAAQLAVLNGKLSHLALHDQLTGLGNRRCAMELLEREWDKVVRYGMPLACLLIDIDRFKQINDTHGHDVGDVVLRETAQVLQAAVRASDAVCRFGGEEFLVICPEADARTSQLVGDRLRAAVAANLVAAPPYEGRVTVSVGAACRTPAVGTLTALLKLADEALYAAKNAGRDRVCVV